MLAWISHPELVTLVNRNLKKKSWVKTLKNHRFIHVLPILFTMIPSHISFSALCTYFSCTILQTAVQCTSYILTDKDHHRWSFLLVYIVLLTCLNKFKIIAGWLAYNFIDFGWSLQTVVWNSFTAGQPIPMRWVNKLEKKTNDIT